MASFILSRSFLGLLLAFIALFSISEAESSFSFTSKNSSFGSEDIALYGDAKLVDGGSSVQLTDSVSHGVGRVVYNKPIEFVETKSEFILGFSSFFSFSMFPGRGGRLGFVVFPVNGTIDHSLFEVKFDTSESFTESGDLNVAVIVNLTTVIHKIRNFTIANLEKKENLLLHAWINYQASGKFLDVLLSQTGSFDAVDTLMFYRTDLSEMLKGEGEFMVGVKTYSGNFSLHSWSLETRRFSKSIHSYPALMLAKLREEEAAKRKRRETIWEIITYFVMTFGSTGLVFFAMMHIWAAFKRNKLVMVMPEECGLKTKEFGYEKMEKMEVVMSKAEAIQGRQ